MASTSNAVNSSGIVSRKTSNQWRVYAFGTARCSHDPVVPGATVRSPEADVV